MQVFHKNFQAMGTRFEIVLPGREESGEDNESVYNEIYDEVKRLEKKLNRFSEDSVISRINAGAYSEPLNIDDETFNVLLICYKYAQATNGMFDITIPPLLDIWNIKHGIKQGDDEPEYSEICDCLRKIGYQHIKLDDELKTISFDKPDVKIDLGGFAKGLALEKVEGLLSKKDIKSAFISFGESSVLAVGTHPYGDSWKIGVQNIFKSGENAASFDIKDSAVSTSGINSQVDISNPATYGHVVNPKTGYPVQGIRTVSVVSNSPLDAEVISTAFLIADEDDRQLMLNQFKDIKVTVIEYSKEGDFETKKYTGEKSGQT